MGHCYLYGEGVEKKEAIAVSWYRKAVAQNDPEAQCYLGNCYYYGNGVAQDNNKAAEYFKKSAEQGFALALLSLSSCYINGEGVQQSYNEAEVCLNKAKAIATEEENYQLIEDANAMLSQLNEIRKTTGTPKSSYSGYTKDTGSIATTQTKTKAPKKHHSFRLRRYYRSSGFYAGKKFLFSLITLLSVVAGFGLSLIFTHGEIAFGGGLGVFALAILAAGLILALMIYSIVKIVKATKLNAFIIIRIILNAGVTCGAMLLLNML